MKLQIYRIKSLYDNKMGKTTMLAELPDSLMLDTEGGTEMIEAVKLPVTSINGATVVDKDGKVTSTSIYAVINEIIAKAQADKAAGLPVKYPYRRLILDTLDQVEDWAEVIATSKYKKTIIGKNFEGASVLDLPNGGGYRFIRDEVKEIIKNLASVCESLIVVTHIKEKLLNKGGIDVSVRDISLTGKLGSIVCAMADIIGYVYREPGKPLMVSFETTESAVMGSRVTRLAGQRFELDWNRIFINEA